MAFLRKLPRCSGYAGRLQLQQVVRERTSTATANATTSSHADARPASTASPTAQQIDPLDLKFNDPVASFKSKTTMELFRAYVVYQLCSVEYLVENNTKVILLPLLFSPSLLPLYRCTCACHTHTHTQIRRSRPPSGIRLEVEIDVLCARARVCVCVTHTMLPVKQGSLYSAGIFTFTYRIYMRIYRRYGKHVYIYVQGRL